MEYSSATNDTTLTISFRGDFGFADNILMKKIITEMKSSDCTLFSIDLSQLQSVDSAGLGMFILLSDSVEDIGKKIEIRKPTGQVSKMLQVSKFSDIITIKN